MTPTVGRDMMVVSSTRSAVSRNLPFSERKMPAFTRQGVRNLDAIGPRSTVGRRWKMAPAPLYCSHIWVSRLMVDTPYGLVPGYDEERDGYVEVCAKCGAPRGL